MITEILDIPLMNYWVLGGFILFGIVILACTILAIMLVRDTKIRQSRQVAAPVLGSAKKDTDVFANASTQERDDAPKTRRERRAAKQKIQVESPKTGIWSGHDSDGAFDLTHGQD